MQTRRARRRVPGPMLLIGVVAVLLGCASFARPGPNRAKIDDFCRNVYRADQTRFGGASYSSIEELVRDLGQPTEMKPIPWSTDRPGDYWLEVRYPERGFQFFYDEGQHRYLARLKAFWSNSESFKFGVVSGMSPARIERIFGRPDRVLDLESGPILIYTTIDTEWQIHFHMNHSYGGLGDIYLVNRGNEAFYKP